MARKVGMIHSIAFMVPVFGEVAAEIMPGVEVIHLVDEGLLKDIWATGKLTDRMARRMGLLGSFAEESGAEVVMLTCSSLGPLLDTAKNMIKVPFLKIDEAMSDEAAKLGDRIGVIATASSTLGPTSDLIKERAALQGKKVEVETALCEGAFEARFRGDNDTHDRIVKENLKELMKRVQVVVLAQASITRVIEQIPEAERIVPILSSPRLGIQRLKEALERLTPKA